jgi:hypothetical protein
MLEIIQGNNLPCAFSASSSHKFVDLALYQANTIKIIGFSQYGKRL